MKVVCRSCEAPTYLSEDDVPEDGSQNLCSRCATPMFFLHVPTEEDGEYFGPAPRAPLARDTPFFEHFGSKSYTLRTRPLKLFGGGVEIYDPAGRLCGYVHQKAFKVKEDVVLYSDEDRTRELLRIGARTYQDISGVYDVTDPASGQRIGSLRRSGMKSMVRDSWTILDADEEEVGAVQEDSALMAGVRRFVPLAYLIPQGFEGEMEGRTVFQFEQEFNPFVLYLKLNFFPDTRGRLDRRLGIAAGILLSLIEGKQTN